MVPLAHGLPNPQGVLVPDLWSVRYNIYFYASTVLSGITNTYWEGELSGMGSRLFIRNLPEIAIYQVADCEDQCDLDTPQPTLTELVIDKAFAFRYKVCDITKFQADHDYARLWAQHAVNNMKVEIDRHVLCNIDCDPCNKGHMAGALSQCYDLGQCDELVLEPIPVSPRAPVAVGGTTMMCLIGNMASVLDERNVPDEPRWMTLPSWGHNYLMKSILTNAEYMGDTTSGFRNGFVGMLDRFAIYFTNNLPTMRDPDTNQLITNIYAGHISAIAFASQLVESEIIRAQCFFGWIARGMQVFGHNVVKPSAMTCACIAKGPDNCGECCPNTAVVG